jgi:urease beta subunit
MLHHQFLLLLFATKVCSAIKFGRFFHFFKTRVHLQFSAKSRSDVRLSIGVATDDCLPVEAANLSVKQCRNCGKTCFFGGETTIRAYFALEVICRVKYWLAKVFVERCQDSGVHHSKKAISIRFEWWWRTSTAPK